MNGPLFPLVLPEPLEGESLRRNGPPEAPDPKLVMRVAQARPDA